MSLVTQLIEKKITWTQFAAGVEAWTAKEFGLQPAAVQADVQAAQDDLKQVASTALGLADTAVGGFITTGTAAAEVAANTFIMSASGGIAAPLTPGLDATIAAGANALKAAIDAEVAAWRASLTAKSTG
jgi:hypothetical protein